MDYEGYRNLFLGASVISIALFIISVVLFIKFRIPKIIGELSGITARKKIKNMKYEAKAINLKDFYNFDDSRTEVLRNNSTLEENKTEVLNSNIENEARTELLHNYENETEVLVQDSADSYVHVVEDITFIHAED